MLSDSGMKRVIAFVLPLLILGVGCEGPRSVQLTEVAPKTLGVWPVQHVRAGLCHDSYSAHQGVEHDNMNILVLGSRVIGEALARDLVDQFLRALFSNEERHVRRLQKVQALEKLN